MISAAAVPTTPLRLLPLFLLAACLATEDGRDLEGLPPDDDRALGRGPVAGATPYDGGTTFRVWAPHAERVSVIGDFNGWIPWADELTREHGNDYFSADVDGAWPGQQYKYVIQRGGHDHYRVDPRAKQVTNSVGNGVIVDPNAYQFGANDFHTPPWNELVLYELHLGTFHDAPGWGPGNWQSATDRLGHLADLGVNAVEVMPPAEFAGDFSWGYNPAFPFAPETAYGTPEDAKRFIDQAHYHGIAVIIDVVHNHWGPSDLPMWCFDAECLGWGNGGVYFYSDWRRDTDWGPRPDYGRMEVRDYIASNAAMWLHEYRADGLRWDSTLSMRKAGGADLPEGWSLLQRVNDMVDGEQPWKLMIAEDLQNETWITRPTWEGGAGFDTQWDGRFVHPIRHNLITREDHDRSMAQVRDAILARYDADALKRVIYTESHDEVANGQARVPEMVWPGYADSTPSKKRATLGIAVMMTSPGIPMLFQGQECLEDGWFRDDDPVDWSRCERFSGIRDMVRDLVHLRRNLRGTTAGLRGQHVNVFHLNESDKVIAYHRWDRGGPGDDVVIVANFGARAYSDYEIGLPHGGTWHVRFNGDWRGYDGSFDDTPAHAVTGYGGGRDGMGYHGRVGLGPYSVVILSQ